MILVDSNVPMYLVGGEHPNKPRAQVLLETVIAQGERLVTDAEVMQEILQRYRAIDRADRIQPAFDLLLGVVDEVFDIGREDAELARDTLLARWELSARDAIHIAVMQRRRIARVISFDTDYDAVPGLERLH